MAISAATLAREAILGLSEDLARFPAHEYLARVTQLLESLYPESRVRFVDLDPSAGTVFDATGGLEIETYRARFRTLSTEHPLIRSYLPLSRSTFTPRRMTDVISQREFLNTRTYSELFRPTGMTHQMGLLTSIDGTRGTSWVINRAGADFSDHELTVAVALQPSLCLLQSVCKRSRAESPCVSSDDSGNRYTLTDRELQVLALVADGLTAVHVSHVLRISVRTVRKHLEHAYAKLDTHDRLVAVTRARAARLIS